MNKTAKKRKGTIHSVDPVLFQRYLNSQPDHVLATLLCQWAFQPGLKFKSSHLWKHFVKWQKTDAALPTLEEAMTNARKLVEENKEAYLSEVGDSPFIKQIKESGHSFEDGV